MANPLWMLFVSVSIASADVPPASMNSVFDITSTWSGLAGATYAFSQKNVAPYIDKAAKYLQAVEGQATSKWNNLPIDDFKELLDTKYKAMIREAAARIAEGLAELEPEAVRLVEHIEKEQTAAYLEQITQASICTVGGGACTVGFALAAIGIEIYGTFMVGQQSSEAAFHNIESDVTDLEADFRQMTTAMLRLPPSAAGGSFRGVATLISQVSVLSDVQSNFLQDVHATIKQVEIDAVNRWNFFCHFDFFGICSPAIPDSAKGSLKTMQQDLLLLDSHTRALQVCAEQPDGCQPAWTSTLVSDMRGKMDSICLDLQNVVCSMPQQDGINCTEAPQCHKAVRGMMMIAAGRRAAGASVRGAQLVSRSATELAGPLALAAPRSSAAAAPLAQLTDGRQFFTALTFLTVSLFASSLALVPSMHPKEVVYLACMVVSASGLTATFVHWTEEVNVKGLFDEVVDKFDHVSRAAAAWGCTADLELGLSLRSITARAPDFQPDLTSWWVAAVALLLLTFLMQIQAQVQAGRPAHESLAQPLLLEVENALQSTVDEEGPQQQRNGCNVDVSARDGARANSVATGDPRRDGQTSGDLPQGGGQIDAGSSGGGAARDAAAGLIHLVGGSVAPCTRREVCVPSGQSVAQRLVY
eukprot:CAMPEP_0115180306 /NCGR_PEP_ID=MMETSP0270-20121206/6852_1 /TAXON_ID=71861 /ORGANISM="Scrippsiella trochoidea, Strain CCMP3099" /LENGTH=642 /DNA_ID=CAMNT_0002593303 /DNA_START=76 /DNA_END=2002 /DNA_ORIENTATION=+